jgi:hypothetical protein
MFKDPGVAQLPEVGVKVYVTVPREDVLMLAGLHVPAIVSFDTNGSAGGVEFWQSGPMALNVGVRVLTIVMFKESGVEQLPADGVNVYVTVPKADVFMLAGLHVPVIPSFDVSGSAGAAVFWQYEFAMVGKVGMTVPTTIIFKETGVEQLLAAGVNVYVAVPGTEVLMLAGLHVPVIPSFDVSGSAGAVAFWQYVVAIVGKVGMTVPTIVMFKEAGVAQLPAVGVNVYVAVPGTAVLILAGLHVPVIPSFDTIGSAGAVVFWQYEFVIVGKVGATVPTIVMFKATGVEQLPAVGVNVYVAVPGTEVLMLAGLHVPVIPSFDVRGNAGAAVFWQ